MKSEKAAIKRLCNSKSKVSSHYFIKKNGQIINLVPDNYIAWHAGKSRWKKKSSLNKNSKFWTSDTIKEIEERKFEKIFSDPKTLSQELNTNINLNFSTSPKKSKLSTMPFAIKNSRKSKNLLSFKSALQ